MVAALAEWFGFSGSTFIPPATLSEFFPYFFTCCLSFCLVAGVLQLVRFAVSGVTKGGRNL